MDLRRRKEAEKEPDKEEKTDNVSAKALRMRRYREKLKTERREKYEEIKRKDAERNKKNRQIEKSKTSDTRAINTQRKVWREKKSKQRAKTKTSENSDSSQKTKETPSVVRKTRVIKSRNGKFMIEQRKAEVKRVQNWRLRVKLRNYTPTSSANTTYNEEDSCENETEIENMLENPTTPEVHVEPDNVENANNENLNSGKSSDNVKDGYSQSASVSKGNMENEKAFNSRSSEYRAIRKAAASMPNTPKRKSKIIERLCESPRTRTHLEKKGVLLTKEARRKLNMGLSVMSTIKKNITKIRENTDRNKKVKKQAYKNVVQSVLDTKVAKHHKFGCAISSYLKVRKPRGSENDQEWWEKGSRKSRKDRLSPDTVRKVEEFYLSLEVSREVPNKKDVKTVSGESVQTHIMTMTLADAHVLFTKKYPDLKIGLTSFKKLKPVNIKKVSETSHKSCLCQTCCNLALKIDALNKYADCNENLKMKLKGLNKDKLADISMCEYDTPYPQKNCLDRTCKSCGPQKLTEFLELETMTGSIDWFHWEVIQVKNDDESTKRVTSCVPKNTSIEDFTKEVENDLKKYPSHIFRAEWQHCQLINRINNLSEGEVIMLMDYSENYRCRFQNESQNVYFDQRQVTVHPFMLYYTQQVDDSDDTEDKCNQTLVKHPIIAISNDVKHDAFAVKVFEKKVIEVLKEESVEVSSVIKFSDGAACQYEGKNTFAHLSKDSISTTHNYFETSHGKSPCDGLGAVVKNTCFRAVVSGKAVIGDAESAYQFCKSRLDHRAKVVKKNSETYISRRNIIYICNQGLKRMIIKRLPVPINLYSEQNSQAMAR